ncbi:hypothetical protein [Holdemania massiliensis]|uniref:hypothetical protein n=1 Tax=Holdemania massiliensis TaxID=1468449 RepID=UPI001F05CB84|nr:hypothetical protein [Holdemania massiliensis]MCH1939767.1 hypothetical protein [Holdemania massiliensis]
MNLDANGGAPAGTPIPNAHEVMEAAIKAGFVFKADTVEACPFLNLLCFDFPAASNQTAATHQFSGYLPM